MAKFTPESLSALLAREFPQALSTRIVALGEGSATVRREIGVDDLRPGRTVSGPVLMALADMATYCALLADIGDVLLAVTTNLEIHFLRKPSADRALVAEARTLKRGKRLAIVEVSIHAEGDDALLACATVTYSIPPAS